MTVKFNSLPNGNFSYAEEESVFLAPKKGILRGRHYKFNYVKNADKNSLYKISENSICEIIDNRIKFLIPLDLSFFHFIQDCIGKVANSYQMCLNNNYSNCLFIF